MVVEFGEFILFLNVSAQVLSHSTINIWSPPVNIVLALLGKVVVDNKFDIVHIYNKRYE